MTDWEDKARAAAVRKSRMMSFGLHAYGLLVNGKHGLFAVDPEDSSVTSWLLNEGTYAESELELATSLISPDSNVLIVGSHIGALAVPISRLCKRMDAIEANPATQKLFQANLLLNRCSNVTLYPVAASDSRETILFLMNRDNSGGSKRKPLSDGIHYIYDNPQVIEVDSYPLDDLLNERSYDLILMDIEGSEYFALKGMQGILTGAKALSVEFLPHHLLDVAGVSPDQFTDQVEQHFDWLYDPDANILTPKSGVRATLRAMYDRGEGHDGLYFLKDVSPDWAAARGLQIPGPTDT